MVIHVYTCIHLKVNLQIGGCALNTVRVFQWLSGNPGKAFFSGAIGNDNHGQLIKDRLSSSGINSELEIVEKYRTGRTVAMVSQNGNLQVSLL